MLKVTLGYSSGSTQYIGNVTGEVRVENIFSVWVEITTSVEYEIAEEEHRKENKIKSKTAFSIQTKYRRNQQVVRERRNIEGR